MIAFLTLPGLDLAVILIPGELYDDIIKRALQSPDIEICGILAGNYDECRSIVQSIFPTENVAGDPTVSFEIDPREQLTVFDTIDSQGIDIVGFFHSHPHGSPHPSDRDVREAAWPNHSYLIIGNREPPRVRSWRWDQSGEEFRAEMLIISRMPYSET